MRRRCPAVLGGAIRGEQDYAIAFRTIPGDDTGAFHILEHSVLRGSERHPVKEPF